MSIKGSCHCRATQFELVEAPVEVTSCNCSFCAKRGPLWAYTTPVGFKLLTARDRVATYQWGQYVGQHHHCAVCGCGTYSEFPDFSSGTPDYDKPKVSVNARLLDDFDLDALPVQRVDGKNAW